MATVREPEVLHRTAELAVVIFDIGESSREKLTAAGQSCVRKAIEELLGSAKGDIAYTDLGAPEWLGESREPDEPMMHVSIAHTGTVAAGAASTSAIGIDLERSDRDVSRLFHGFNPVERSLTPRWSALEILCAKEAAGKAQKIGLAGSIKRWQVSEISGRMCVTDCHQAVQIDPPTWSIEVLHTSKGSIPLTCVVAVP